jgi:transposase
VIPWPARSLGAVHEQRRATEAQISTLLEDHPLAEVLTSPPGVGVRTAATLLVTAAPHDPASPTYGDRCRARGKTHTQALVRLARQRINVLFALLRDGTFYEPGPPRLA